MWKGFLCIFMPRYADSTSHLNTMSYSYQGQSRTPFVKFWIQLWDWLQFQTHYGWLPPWTANNIIILFLAQFLGRKEKRIFLVEHNSENLGLLYSSTKFKLKNLNASDNEINLITHCRKLQTQNHVHVIKMWLYTVHLCNNTITLPLTPLRSLDTATWMVVWAPCLGVFTINQVSIRSIVWNKKSIISKVYIIISNFIVNRDHSYKM